MSDKILHLHTCGTCAHIDLSNDSLYIYCGQCFKILGTEIPEQIPDFCPLEDYKPFLEQLFELLGRKCLPFQTMNMILGEDLKAWAEVHRPEWIKRYNL
jgi:hypothetical protein